MLKWFAAYTRSRREQVVATALASRGYETLYPTYHEISRWSDRQVSIARALFPCYLFVRCDARLRGPVVRVPGLVHLVSCGREPLPVGDDKIESIRLAMESGEPLRPAAYLATGDRVRIERGPLAGLTGILREGGHRPRVVVSVELLARSLAVEVEASWLAK